MLTQKMIVLLALYFTVQSQTLSQIVLQGTVTDNGAEYLGSGAEAVVNALVTVTDQADASRSFSSVTSEQGQYSIQITPTRVDDEASAGPADFRLLQNYPNPFNPSTVIGFELSHPSYVGIEIHNILGQRVKVLLNNYQESSGQVVWNALDESEQAVPAGLYIYSMRVGDARINRKMLLMNGRAAINGQASDAVVTPAISSAAATTDRSALCKLTTEQYTLFIVGTDIETFRLQNLEIARNMTVDLTVRRTVTDSDGNIYKTVKIGDQWWMAENLKVTRYRNDDPIPYMTDFDQWRDSTAGAWCVYDHSPANKDTYGVLYNWYALNDSRNITPAGWHVPTYAEWQILVDYLGGITVAGGKIKEAGTEHWYSPNHGANNSSGFSALPGGYHPAGGAFSTLGYHAYFWSSTEYTVHNAWHRDVAYYHSNVDCYENSKENGLSVRCVRD